MHRLADLGAYGVTFHDDDLIPFGSDDRRAGRLIERFREALAETGLTVPMVTTNLFSHPVFKDGGFTANDRDVRRYALRKVMRNIDLAAELGAKTYVLWGGREGAETDAAKDVRGRARPLPRKASTRSPHTSRDQGYDIRFALEPKPNEPRGDILLPTVGHALAFISTLDHARHGRAQPGGRPRADGRPELRPRHRPGAVARASCSTSTSTASTASSSTRTCVFGARRPARRLLPGRPAGERRPGGGPAYDGPRHFDYKPLRTEDIDGVWESAAANMRTYLLLKERAAAFRADPAVQEALTASRIQELTVPTFADGETYADLLADPSAFENFDAGCAGSRGYGYVRLDQLAIEHLFGAR